MPPRTTSRALAWPATFMPLRPMPCLSIQVLVSPFQIASEPSPVAVRPRKATLFVPGMAASFTQTYTLLTINMSSTT